LKQSLSGNWSHDPKNVCCLFEDLYVEEPDRTRRKEQGWERIRACLTHFHSSPTWEKIQRTKPDNWIVTDLNPFQTASLSVPMDDETYLTIPFHGRPDFGYGRFRDGQPTGRCYVMDWKTGKPRDSDLAQMRFYALFAEQIWGFPCSDISVRLIYLWPEYEEEETFFSAEQLVGVRKKVKDSFVRMLDLVADKQSNEAVAIENFPQTTQMNLCPSCSFQEICDR
jgi:hypothetical protein